MKDPKDITINGEQLSAILEEHRKWLLNNAEGKRAYLQGADLQGADLRDANLQGAYLQGAYLRDANLQGAYLRDANLQRADLQGANLRDANLQGANLQGAYLQGARNAELAMAMTVIVPEGAVVGWKKCRDNVIVKLQIPAKAQRSNGSGRKCRSEYVKVLEVIGAEVGIGLYNEKVEYRKGQIVKADSWDDDRWNECSHGIHFFITREEAEAFDM
jgi:hypothetical protein